MGDVQIALGSAGARAGADLKLLVDRIGGEPGPPFWETTAAFDVEDYVVVDGRPVADNEGASIASIAGADSATSVLVPPDPLTLFPEAYAHWVPGTEHMSNDSGLYRWWPVGGVRAGDQPRMSLFKQDRVLDGTTTGMLPYGDGVGAPQVLNSYTYQGFGRQMQRKAVAFNSRGFAKIDPEGTFPSATFAVTAVLHPSGLPYYGIFEADTGGAGEPLVLRYHHGQLRLYHNEKWVLSHESHRMVGAEPVIILVSFDAATDTGRFYCLDANRTTRTFNTVGMDVVSLLGIFGGLGQGIPSNPYNRYTADMDVLDVCLWDHAMDWPELESKVNLLSLAYGVTA